MKARILRVDKSYRTPRNLSVADLTSTGRHIDDLGAGFVVLDSATTYVMEANETFADWIGASHSEMQGKSFLELLGIEHDESFRKNLQALHDNSGSTLRCEFAFRTISNATIWIELIFTSQKIDSQSTRLVSALAIDVTDRQVREADFARTIECLELSQDQARVGSFVLEVGAVCGWWSKTLYDLHGLDSMKGPPTVEDFLDRVHPEDRRALVVGLRSLTKKRKPLVHDFRSDPKYGVVKYFRVAVSVQERNGNQFYYGAVQDITIQHNLEVELCESEGRYRRVVEMAAEGNCVVDNQGVVISVNEAGAQMLGFTINELIGTNLGDLKFENRQESLQTRADENRKGISQVYETKLKHRSGRDVWLLVSTQPVMDEQGNLVQVRGTMIDITDRKKLEMITRDAAVANAKLEMLSKGEREVLKHVIDGKMNKVIARQLDISETTVERRRSSLMKKLRVKSITELVRLTLMAEVHPDKMGSEIS